MLKSGATHKFFLKDKEGNNVYYKNGGRGTYAMVLYNGIWYRSSYRELDLNESSTFIRVQHV